MSVRSSTSRTRRLTVRTGAFLGVGALAAASLALSGAGPAAAATPLLKSANIANYSGVLENAQSFSIYVLSVEKGAKLHCTGACLSTWRPLVVKSSVKAVSVAKSVKGKIGFVKRTATTKQVTFNSFPIYTFVGDSGPNQSNGEAVSGDGGVWHLAHAAARSAGGTAYAPILNATSVGTTYTGVLANKASYSLYVLSSESGGTLHCNGSCLSTWPPLLVTAATTKISLGGGVDGTIGFVTRGSMKQVTFNNYPVYTYTGDTGPSQSCGENIKADGGTWTLASAAATSTSATPVAPVSGGGCVGGY
jgi:predicted lipoprotein with Yx(FWY)xxD motif